MAEVIFRVFFVVAMRDRSSRMEAPICGSATRGAATAARGASVELDRPGAHGDKITRGAAVIVDEIDRIEHELGILDPDGPGLTLVGAQGAAGEGGGAIATRDQHSSTQQAVVALEPGIDDRARGIFDDESPG
jgi:hypothetical protein